MKAIRTREEKLDEVKRRRKSLAGKADAADKKLGKMSSENKNFQAQADSLNKLRDEIRALDTDIMHEEASLGDFKRSIAKYWMGIKFGAIMECSEKGMVSLHSVWSPDGSAECGIQLVGELGKLVIDVSNVDGYKLYSLTPCRKFLWRGPNRDYHEHTTRVTHAPNSLSQKLSER